MKRLSKVGFVFVATVLVLGCGPLRKSQVALVRNYFGTIADHPANVRQLNERLVELSLESKNLKSTLYPSDSLRITSLMQAIDEYENNLAIPDSISQELALFENYISSYYILLPGGFNVYSAFKSTSESVVGIFGFQSIVSSVLPEKAENVSAAKKKRMQAHLDAQSEELHRSLRKIKGYIDRTIIPEIDRTHAKIGLDVQRLFMNGGKPLSSLDHYFNYNNYFINYFQKIIRTRKLAVSISKSLQDILETEREIQRLTATPQKIKSDSDRLHYLAADLQRIKVLMAESEL